MTFEIDTCWFDFSKLPSGNLVQQWLREEHPELLSWLETSISGAYKIESRAIDWEYDSNYGCFALTITYDCADDAFLHRMRW